MLAQAFILAAGLGTRLRPLTDYRPKPLVPLLGTTVLDQALAACVTAGFDSVVVNAHHLAEQVVRHCANGLPEALRGLDIHVQVELPEILGTGGGLKAALPLLADPFVVVNGDTLCDADLAALRRECQSPDADAVLLLRQDPHAGDYGIVAVDASGIVVRLASVARAVGADLIANDTHFTGIHALSHAALGFVPPEGFSCIVRTAYRELVPRRRIRGIVHRGDWLDIGNPASYLRACLDVLGGRLRLSLDPFAGGTLLDSVWLGGGAVIGSGCHLGPEAVIGRGATIGEGCRLSRTVVWDGASVPPGTVLDGAVVHDGGVLRIGTITQV